MLRSTIHIIYTLLIIVGFSTTMIAQQGTSPVGVDFILVNFNTPPITLSVEQAPLKYNKDFALSMQEDDYFDDIYEIGLPFFEGLNGNPGLFYSDGCGNNHSFKMSAAFFVFNGNSENGPDILDNYTNQHLTWAEVDSLYKYGWGVQNHGVNGSDNTSQEFMNYSVMRNRSYVRRNLYNTIEGGVISSIFVNPNGSQPFSQVAFDLGFISALNQAGKPPFGINGGNVNTIDWTQSYDIDRKEAAVNLPSLVNSMYNLSVNGANYWSPVFTHNLSYNTFQSDFNTIADTYGVNGLDNILMTTDEEIQDYLIVRDLTDINYNLSGTTLLITFTGEVPDNLLFYSMSLVINSDATINNITVSGTESYTDTIINNTNALININWDGYYVIPPEVLGDSMVTIAWASQNEYDCWVAMDYVITMTNGTHKDSLREVLCSIPNVDYDDGFCDCTISLSPDADTINLGDSYTLTGPGPGPLGNYDYLWEDETDSIANTQTHEVTPDTATQYYLTATNPYGCPAIDSITVNIHQLNIDLGDDREICSGETDTIFGPTNMTQYQWYRNNSPVGTNNYIVITPTENNEVYKLSVTDQYGLTDTDSLTITLLLLPEADINPQDSTIILGDTLGLSGPINSSYNYYWSLGIDSLSVESSISVNPDEDQLYHLQVTGLHGCSSKDSTMVYVHWLPLDLNQDTDICFGDSVLLEAPINMVEYIWSNSDTIIDTIADTYAKPTSTSYYFLEITDSIGASAYDSVKITVLPVPTVDLGPPETLIILEDSIALYGATDATSWIWYKDGYEHDTDTNLVDWPVNNPTQYLHIATNDDGCSSSDSITVNVHSIVLELDQETVEICNGDSALLIGPSGMLTYYWYCEGDTVGYDSLYIVTDSITAYYKLMVTDSIGASAVDSINVIVNPIPEVYIIATDTILNYGDCDTLEGPTGFSNYFWFENGIQAPNDTLSKLIIWPTSDSEYVLSVLDQEGCEGNDTVNITLQYINLNLGPDTTICKGDSVYLEGPPNMITYLWEENGSYYSTDPSIEPSPDVTSEYTLMVVDQFSIVDRDTIIIYVLPVPTVDLGPPDTTIILGDTYYLVGANDAIGWEWFKDTDTVPFSYQQDTLDVPNDTVQYKHIATNTYGCKAKDSIMVNVHSFTFYLGPNDTICPGECDSIFGAPPDMASYEWYIGDSLLTDDTTQIIVVCPLDTTTYTLVATDTIGAQATDSITYYMFPTPTVDLQPKDSTIISGGCIDLSGYDSTGYSYQWYLEDSLLTNTTYLINECPTADSNLYTLIVTNADGCSAEDSAYVFVNQLSFDLGPDRTICSGIPDTIIGPANMDVYTWYENGTYVSSDDTLIITPIETTEYLLEVDSAGATAKDSIIINVIESPTVYFEEDTVHGFYHEDIELSVIASEDVTLYAWVYDEFDTITFSNSVTLKNIEDSAYIISSVLSENGCNAMDSVYLSVIQCPLIVVSNDDTICFGDSTEMSVSGGEYFRWIQGNDTISSDSIIKVGPKVTTNYIAQTAYTISGCYSSDTIEIIVHDSIPLNLSYDTSIVCTYELIELTASGADKYTWMPGGDTTQEYSFIIYDTTKVWLTGISVDGCIGIDSVEFYNLPPPMVNFTGLLPAYCETDPGVDLIGEPEGGIFGGPGTVGPKFNPGAAGPGSHDIYYKYPDPETGCLGYDTNTTMVYANAGEIDLGEDFTLLYTESKSLDAGEGFDSYLWTTGEVTRTINIVGSDKTVGTYEYVVIGLLNACSTRGSVYVTFEGPDGYNENDIHNLMIYPNPNNGNFNVKFNTVEKDIQLKLFNPQGQQIYHDSDIVCGEDCMATIELEGVIPGFYILKIITGKGVTTAKVVLK